MTRSVPKTQTAFATQTVLRRKRCKRRGLTLLEVILSLAILGLSLTSIGHLVNLGYRSASQALLRSDANIYLDSKMAEIVSGVVDLESSTGIQCDPQGDWICSFEVEPSEYLGLLIINVRVTQNPSRVANPISIGATRFIADPDFDPTEIE